jgi:putative transposase
VPRFQPSKVMQIIKSMTAREFFKQFPEVRKQPWGANFGVMEDILEE